MKRWYAKYHADGFDIVGVHFGEIAMGYNADNVREAAKRFQLPWPVVADLHGSIWRAYHSDVWPNRYLIDQNGDIILHIEGEGNNRPMEEKIRELFSKIHPEVSQIPPDPPENTFELHAAFRPTKHTLEIGSDGARLLPFRRLQKRWAGHGLSLGSSTPRMARLFSLVTG